MARVEIEPGAVDRLADDLVDRYHKQRAPVVLLLMQTLTPVDTGELRGSGRVDPVVYRDRGFRTIRFWFDRNNNPPGVSVAQIVFAGRREVRPVRAKALRWVTKKGAVVFAMRSRAVAPNRWTLRAFQAIGLRNPHVERRSN